ncbi:MAG: DHH family phosphoesterase [Phycisphaerales bacterium]|nr:MAG: DHH family phosphoesterase [Phycisphaerales bacterium]
MNVPDGLIERLTSWRRAVIVGHVTPDADCLGSMIALAKGLADDRRCEVTVSLPPGSVSQRLAFILDQADPALADPRAFAEADGIVVVDTAKVSRCNVDRSIPDNWADGKTVINIDHHASNTRFGDINWVEAEASSTAEMVYWLLLRANRSLSPMLCSLLYAGMITDTVGFTLSSTAPGTLRVAGEVVAQGADVAQIGERMYRSLTAGEFRLLQTIYANTRVVADGRIAYSTADHDEITGAGCTAADIDDQVNVPRSLRGVKIAMLLTEGVRGKTRINFRGESGVEVLELARSLGGGGHAEAAGAILDMPIDQAVPLVVARTTEYVDRLSGGSDS